METHELRPEEVRKLLPTLLSWRRLPACLDLSEGLPQVDLVSDALPGVRLLERGLQSLNEQVSDSGEKQLELLSATKRR
jgi:hypothetical protein